MSKRLRADLNATLSQSVDYLPTAPPALRRKARPMARAAPREEHAVIAPRAAPRPAQLLMQDADVGAGSVEGRSGGGEEEEDLELRVNEVEGALHDMMAHNRALKQYVWRVASGEHDQPEQQQRATAQQQQPAPPRGRAQQQRGGSSRRAPDPGGSGTVVGSDGLKRMKQAAAQRSVHMKRSEVQQRRSGSEDAAARRSAADAASTSSARRPLDTGLGGAASRRARGGKSKVAATTRGELAVHGHRSGESPIRPSGGSGGDPARCRGARVVLESQRVAREKMVALDQRKQAKLAALEQVRTDLQRKVALAAGAAPSELGLGASSAANAARSNAPVAWRKV